MSERYTFRLERTSYKSRDLVYESDGHKLVIYLEMSGVRAFDWIGNYSDLAKWNTPAGKQITSEERAELLKHLLEWSKRRNVCIAFEERSTGEKWTKEHKELGFATQLHKDGTAVISTPSRRGLIARLLRNVFSRNEYAA